MSTLYERILVPLDGSKPAEKALEKAIEYALLVDSHLILAHVIDYKYLNYATGYEVDIRRNTNDSAEKLMNGYKQQVLESGITKVEVVIKEGVPKVTISETLVEEYNIDLIIIGATGYNALEKFFIGSTTEFVNRNTKSDILVVRNRD